MEHDPMADVVILSLDRVEDTVSAIVSAVEQTGVAKRVWVIDQGSTPETVATLRNFVAGKDEVHLEVVGRNLGVPGGRNLAARLGNAPYIVSLDNDAVFQGRDALAKAVSCLEGHQELAAIGFRILNYHTRDDDEPSWGYPKALRAKCREAFLTTKFMGGGHAIRRSAFTDAGGYDDSLFFCWEEMDLCYRFINAGKKIMYYPEVTVLHKVSSEQHMDWGKRRYYYFTRNILYIYFKYGASAFKTGGFAVAYLIKGAYNGVPMQGIKAVIDAARMCSRLPRQRRKEYRLSEGAKRYIFENEIKYRGGIGLRIKREVFAKLAGKS